MTGALRTADLVAKMADYILSQHPSRFTAQTLPRDQSLLELGVLGPSMGKAPGHLRVGERRTPSAKIGQHTQSTPVRLS